MTGDILLKSKREAMEKYGFGTEAMKKIKVCPSCGEARPSDEKTCPFCGASLGDETLYDAYKERHVFCRNCGEVAPNGAKFCPQCGKRINQ